jgi:type I restriction enzyme M protein
VVLDALKSDLVETGEDRIARHRRVVISAFDSWWEKYQTPLSSLEAVRNAAAVSLAGLFEELGYE